MSEKANYVFSVKGLAEKVVVYDTKLVYQPGFHILSNPVEIFRIKRAISLWDINETSPDIKRENQKNYLLGVQCFEDLLRLLSVDDPVISELHISDEEVRISLKKGADYKMLSLINRVSWLTKRLDYKKKEGRLGKRRYKKEIYGIADRFGGLQELRSNLFATPSGLIKS